jgi:hypothetical protein
MVALGILDAIDAALCLVLPSEYQDHLITSRISRYQATEHRSPEALGSNAPSGRVRKHGLQVSVKMLLAGS